MVATVKKLFDQLMSRLEREIPPEEYRRWFSPVSFGGGTSEELTIQVPNIFFENWIKDRYQQKMVHILSEINGRTLKISLAVNQASVGPSETGEGRPASEPGGVSDDGRDQGRFHTKLIEKFTFDNFVVGNSNQLAYAASQAVANRSAAYNPLFIYGGSGLGKTHLLNAIGNHIVRQDPTLKVVYMSSEEFTNELIEALRSEGMASFRQKYRNIDSLLIDDIHFIGGRERTQEEFFYTFNSLYESDKQIVLSSDKMPKDIPDLEERLRSRFEGGLFADITPPDRETKVAILSRKAEEEGIELSTEVAFYLAGQNESNVRVLEGYLSRLGAYSSLTKRPIDLASAEKLLGLFIESEHKKITFDLILKVASDFFQIKISDLKSDKKQRSVAAPRQAVMYMARQLTGLSTTEIGQNLGGRDHSTVIHAVKKVESKMEQDQTYNRLLAEFKNAVQDEADR